MLSRWVAQSMLLATYELLLREMVGKIYTQIETNDADEEINE